jgi:hypothetical protein
MRNIPVEFIEGEGGEIVVLLTTRQQKKTLAFIEDRKKLETRDWKEVELFGYDPAKPPKDQEEGFRAHLLIRKPKPI